MLAVNTLGYFKYFYSVIALVLALSTMVLWISAFTRIDNPKGFGIGPPSLKGKEGEFYIPHLLLCGGLAIATLVIMFTALQWPGFETMLYVFIPLLIISLLFQFRDLDEMEASYFIRSLVLIVLIGGWAIFGQLMPWIYDFPIPE